MIVIVNDNSPHFASIGTRTERQKFARLCLDSDDFREWASTASSDVLEGVEGVVVCIGSTSKYFRPSECRRRCWPAIAVTHERNLTGTINLLGSGYDDVVDVSIHPRELMARLWAIRARAFSVSTVLKIGPLEISLIGGDHLVAGKMLNLTRRERSALGMLARRVDRWVDRSQLFGLVYGMFEVEVNEKCIEVHVSRLRQKLRDELGYSPIQTMRYMGYRLSSQQPALPKSRRARDQKSDAHAGVHQE